VTVPDHLNAEMSPRVILIDDDKDFLDAQVQALELAGFTVQAFLSGTEAMRHMTREFDGVIVSDVRMPNMDGLSLFKHVHELDPELPVLLLTGHGDVPMAVQALKDGVYDFLIKPFSVAELIASLGRASQKRELVIENRSLRKLHAGYINAKTALIGESMVMDSLRQTLSQIAEADVDVLITGEGGAGKKTAARSLHSLSHRKAKPFVQISCASLSEDNFYAEVFGSESEEKAPLQRHTPKRLVGHLERAHRGTILFDDVGSLSLQQQAALLRVIETREYRPRGADEPRLLDLRIIATSRQNLRDAVQKGTFRADLFYLLSGVTLHVPPLSERRSDIRLLFQHFLFAACARTKRPIPRLTIIAHMHLQRHDWPGNVRELERFAERFALGLDPEEGSNSISNSSPGLAERINQFEAELIQEVLSRYQGDAKRSMEILKLPRKTFYDKLSRHGIRISDYRGKK
jgi:two-component system, NtrC family, C4-dicarboxylate transport response regulator DctD